MEMVRSFFPVGQGAFYAEQFKDKINIIYDCGSQTGVEIVEKMIESTFDKGEDIYAVFISHLHSDHINGLEFLLKYCKVKTLYLPYLTPQNIVISSLIQDVTQGGCSQFISDFIRNPEGALKKHCEKNAIPQPEIKYVLSQDDVDSLEAQIESNIKKYHCSGDPIYLPVESVGAKWVCIPYNLKNHDRKKKLVDELKKIGVDVDDSESIMRKLSTKAGKHKIKKAYEAVPGGLNTNSMLLYSGPNAYGQSKTTQRVVTNPFCAWECFDCCGSIRPGCLYMGDFDASDNNNFDLLDSWYADYWGKVGILQIPHHGSKYNFNSALLSKASWFVISAGTENKYKHPHARVVKEIILYRHSFAWVTEKVNSLIRFCVSN